MTNKPRSILITGASSGLGEALTRAYAEPGISLHLIGRDEARLGTVAEAAAAAGAAVRTHRVDVTDRTGMERFMLDCHARAPLDLVIANAGISGGTGGLPSGSLGEGAAQTRAVFGVNLDGVLNTVLPAIPLLAETRGQIAIMSSLAGHRGWPGAPAYSGSKAAVKAWGEALRGALAPQEIRVSVIMPGFVRTRMTDANDFSMPFLMEADAAAQLIKRQLAKNVARIAFPFPMALMAWTLGALPPALVDSLLARMPRKGHR